MLSIKYGYFLGSNHIMIDPKFLNLEIYSIYSAALKLMGFEKQKEVVELSGEIIFLQLKNEINLLNVKKPADLVFFQRRSRN